MYLERAGRARDHAHKAANEAERAFYERMEWSWANLAAKTASLEGVDLLLHARQHDRLPPLSQCPDCSRLMKVRVIKVERDRLVHNFECVSCGCREERSTTASSDDGFPGRPGAGRSGQS
jgi:Zn ribbon nucleic-acid-binding protein